MATYQNPFIEDKDKLKREATAESSAIRDRLAKQEAERIKNQKINTIKANLLKAEAEFRKKENELARINAEITKIEKNKGAEKTTLETLQKNEVDKKLREAGSLESKLKTELSRMMSVAISVKNQIQNLISTKKTSVGTNIQNEKTLIQNLEREELSLNNSSKSHEREISILKQKLAEEERALWEDKTRLEKLHRDLISEKDKIKVLESEARKQNKNADEKRLSSSLKDIEKKEAETKRLLDETVKKIEGLRNEQIAKQKEASQIKQSFAVASSNLLSLNRQKDILEKGLADFKMQIDRLNGELRQIR